MLSEKERPLKVGQLERLILRARRHYERMGYSRLWIDQRMRSVSARHELVSEWYRCGVRESEQFRALTNELFVTAFGMDVEAYRRYKGLFRTRENLRDHMTDLELSLASLAETTTVELHRRRRSSGFDALLLDVKDAGKIIARARRDIEAEARGPVVSAANHLPQRPSNPPLPPTNLAA
jgi:DNA-damage-inducible protein D